MSRWYSRRRVLLAVAGACGTVSSGCVGWLKRSTKDTHELSVTEAEPEYTADAFGGYVDRMQNRYGSYGVWGRDSGGPATNGASEPTLVGAWSDQWVLGPHQQTDEKQIRVPIDAAAALYRIRPDTHRLWLWTAATPTQPETGVGDTTLTSLSVGVDLERGVLDSYSPSTSISPKDTPLTIGVDSNAPTARFVLPAGGVQPRSENTNGGNAFAFTVGWAGGYGNTLSVVGVCELHRPTDSEYELTLRTDASASQGTL